MIDLDPCVEKRAKICSIMNAPWQPIYSIERSGIAEVTIFGAISVVTGDAKMAGQTEALLTHGDPDITLWTRSVLKPWQLLSHLPCLKSAYPQLKPEHIALMMSSHNAEVLHQGLLSEIMSLGDVSESMLQCPASYPLYAELRRQMVAEGLSPRPLLHNCSGKHFGYLMAIKAQQGDPSQYLKPEAERFQKLQGLLCQLLQRTDSHLPVTTDGCQLPNYAVSINEMARLYHGLANPQLQRANGELSEEARANYSELSRLMSTYPRVIGGTGRIDTELMSDKLPLEGRPHLIVKQGADGLLSLGLGPSERYPNGLGILIKVASGFDAKQMELIAGELFAQLGLREHDSPHPSQPKGTRRDHISVVHHFRVKAMSDISG